MQLLRLPLNLFGLCNFFLLFILFHLVSQRVQSFTLLLGLGLSLLSFLSPFVQLVTEFLEFLVFGLDFLINLSFLLNQDGLSRFDLFLSLLELFGFAFQLTEMILLSFSAAVPFLVSQATILALRIASVLILIGLVEAQLLFDFGISVRIIIWLLLVVFLSEILDLVSRFLPILRQLGML